ncbi:receptor-interacting serine/threonine-protein kinase 2-like isoform X2 [Bufo bufo]|uniref:receptor-interacting serine/threonine-protein kinase 2-like isoform X2 n=1 Tax=Bufo bufo TaxID=8384 RepID=UPI001ABE7CB2|nr:receptor-interacting serine/threonine-protein kinase 2-like isoform X2 [Bufo bufo]XP_040265804.1 receptor-interacting serine/threonine-protein kinase 2-like isoform X2 [Bufo bufo]XP_040265805.1 receptor-interacting serine/threonine-protein kinase 2-like isoform X2 [Bufo bufo]
MQTLLYMSEMSLSSISRRDLPATYQIVKTSTEPVYKSTYLPTGCPVFIKLLPLAKQNKRDRQTILRAVEYASRRRSERLAEIVGLFWPPNAIGIVTVWMSNESLHSLLYQRDLYPTLPLSIRIRILADVAAGLSFLHNQQHPIMFQRLKPCNILLDAQYRVKLSDFWLSNFQKVSFSKEEEENTSVIYLSPQRLKNNVLSTADDIYSFGITVHETLSRKQPFKENNPLKLETEITSGIRPQPNIEVILEETSLQQSQRANLSQLTNLCWHQNPFMRPTADECLTRLNEVLQKFSKEEIQRDIDTLNTGKERAVQQPQEHIMECDIEYLNECWLSRSHMSRAQSMPEESTEEDLSCPEARKQKRSASLPVSGSKINIHVPTTCPEQMRRAARNCGVSHMHRNGADCHSSPHLVWAQNYTETLKKNRETILKRVSEGHLNHLIDIMRSKFVLSRDDSENINAERTLKERTRKCLDTCSEKGEEASRMFLDGLRSRNAVYMHP